MPQSSREGHGGQAAAIGMHNMSLYNTTDSGGMENVPAGHAEGIEGSPDMPGSIVGGTTDGGNN